MTMPRGRSLILIATLCGACSSGTAEVTPEPSVAAPPSAPPVAPIATPTEPTPTPPPIEPEPPEPSHDGPVVALAASTTERAVEERWINRLEVDDVDRPAGSAVRILHPDAVVRARLEALVAQTLDAFAADVSDHAGESPFEPPRCAALAATRAVVSIECTSSWDPGGRGSYPISVVEAYAFEIVGQDVRPTTVEAALVPGVDISDALATGLRDAIERDPYTDEQIEWSVLSRGLGIEGLHVVWLSEYGEQTLDGVVPYASLLNALRADGPVARMLRLGAFTHGASPAPTEASATGSTTGPWVIGAGVPMTEAATRWLALPARLRSAVSFYSTGPLVQLGVASTVGIEGAREVANALHGTLSGAAAGTPVSRPVVYRANGSVNVRANASSEAPWLGTLPRDALVVATEVPTEARADGWRSVVTAGAVGHASGRYLELDSTACFPDAVTALARVEDGARDAALRSVIRIRTTAFQAGRGVPSVLFLSHDDTRSWVSLRRLSSTCRVGEEIGAWTLDGSVVDALVTRTASGGGETLVLVQTSPQDTVGNGTTWSALRLGTAAPVWSRAFESHPSIGNDVRAPARVGPSGRGFWPMAIVERGRPIVPFRWDGTTLVEDVP